MKNNHDNNANIGLMLIFILFCLIGAISGTINTPM